MLRKWLQNSVNWTRGVDSPSPCVTTRGLASGSGWPAWAQSGFSLSESRKQNRHSSLQAQLGHTRPWKVEQHCQHRYTPWGARWPVTLSLCRQTSAIGPAAAWSRCPGPDRASQHVCSVKLLGYSERSSSPEMPPLCPGLR